ncbi:guanylate cyclase 32E [Onthophagus taurus]|uniref:guanylate cyclase 32E n=1 Tax=Onthophagus taurus TaxID=166361 RepID=UPI000C20BE68|nr:guanylate cyclase 32E [Onthophagus taurus]
MWCSFLLIFLTVPTSNGDTYIMGYLTGSRRLPGDNQYSRPGLTISGALTLARDEVNNGILGERGHKLDVIVAETYGKERISVNETANLRMKNVSVYIGPQETCEHEAFMAAAFNLPMISYYCTFNATSDKTKYPTFARTRPPAGSISKSVASVLKTFNWTHVVLLYLKSSDTEFAHIASTILHSLHSIGITVVPHFWENPFLMRYVDNPFHKLVEDTYQDTRIYVILGFYYEYVGLMMAMDDKKLFDNGEYFVVGVHIEQYAPKAPARYFMDMLKDEVIPQAEKAFQSYIGIVPTSPIGFKNFTRLVNRYMEKEPFRYPNPAAEVGGQKEIGSDAAYLYDAVHIYAKALTAVMDSGGDVLNGTAIINSIKKTRYKSAMGYMVNMDENADAEGNYTVIARKRFENSGMYGLFPVGIFALPNGNDKLPILRLFSEIDWVAKKPPIAIPKCGFRGEKCESKTAEILSYILGGIFSVVLVLLFGLYRNWTYEKALDSLLWKVDFKDIQMCDEMKQIGTKLTRALHPMMRTSQVSLSSNPDADFRYSSIYTQIGIYRGRVFAIKKIHKKSIDITREMKKELKMIRDLRHNNLNGFIGACTDPPNICIVTEYCTRGSLKDILENEDVKLDNMFIASLIGDILRGMIYLHDSPIRFHGSLHTGNCLVDSRWVVKLADFGLHEFKRDADDPSLKDHSKILEKYKMLLYRAPELLRTSGHYMHSSHPVGSQKGDVYSFGIILYELYGRQGPFGNSSLSSAEILNRIIHCVSVPFRPPLEALENSFDFVRECLKECWKEDPEERPDFKSIRTKLRPLRKGMKPNIFDNMMAMMEKYANNLEVLVNERTDQLQEEKKKTEALLYEMLPRPVAEQLKKGNKVEAESFDCVTIYFSDIVGFTSMSAESTPLEVVDFLNDLYTCFDSIIENYDVYKVETIGDAYMVVSGLPLRNDNQHAGEVATLSLHLLSAVKAFTIRHRPNEKLMLRIGIHSGPVCAGVVGLKMPRYCLFGDTVNTASRMESTGSPLKIHCSKQCRDLLTTLGGYHMVERGIISMKGKGELRTYWLIGENANMRSLRRKDRENRRTLASGLKPQKNGQIDSNGHCIIPRSSLKNKNHSPKSPLARCSSFESPKKLRFASFEYLENKQNYLSKNLEVLKADHKKSTSSLRGNSMNCCGDLKTCSTSCPCIENLANSAATLAQSQLSMLCHEERATRKSSKSSYSSVPTLYSTLNVLELPNAVSAPDSPTKDDMLEEIHKKTEREFTELTVYGESAPLLQLPQPIINSTV